MYSNSKVNGKSQHAINHQSRRSGEFDDFNTVTRQSKKLKYRGLQSNKFNKSGSRSVKKRSNRVGRVKDFYEKLSKEFDEEDDEVNGSFNGGGGRVMKRESRGDGFRSYMGREGWW
jgi:hypothetical protein